jgi:hypothetical protein
MGKELNEAHKQGSSGKHGAEGLLLQVVPTVHASSVHHASSSNTCWKWWKLAEMQIQ